MNKHASPINSNNALGVHTIATALQAGMTELRGAKLSIPEHVTDSSLVFDCEILLAFCIDKPRTYLLAWPDHCISDEHFSHYLRLIKQRAECYPIAYIVGKQEFWSLNFKVSPDVLIPRPETECLVEYILEHLNASNHDVRGLDLGTGSGAIALALAHERSYWSLFASDISERALCVAKENKDTLAVHSVSFIHSDWFSNIELFDLDFIVSNPPYLEDDAKELDCESILHEPRHALTSGRDGLNAIAKICEHAGDHLKPGGLLIIEHGSQQASKVQKIFQHHHFNAIKSHNDYAGLARFTVGFKCSNSSLPAS